MIELDLLGTGADGESLVLTDADGQRYAVPITDELRGAVRRDRPAPRQAGTSPSLRPRDIQALLRSGMAPEEIARQYDIDVDHVHRFEAPVIAEQQYVLARVRDSHVGGDPGAPVLGDLVVDRLAARGVAPDSLVWSARRAGTTTPWEIVLTFVQGAAEHAAHWTFVPTSESFDAVDQEARWLTETIAQAPTSPIFTALPARDRTMEDSSEDIDDLRVREALLEQLNAARGHRQDVDMGSADLEDPAGPAPAPRPDIVDPLTAQSAGAAGVAGPTDAPRESISARIYSLAHARTRGTDEPVAAGPPVSLPSPAAERPTVDPPHASTGSDTLPGLEVPADELPGAPRKKRSRRRSVPSWDEIVFGSHSR